ncbi:MAG: Hsp70 family protein [Ilumatobacteraceae bacterium]
MAGEYTLGIDIGTTFTAAAVCRDGRATVCTLGTRAQSIPTVVAVLADGQVLVGEPAERRATIDPAQVAREFKRRLGDTTPLVLGATSYTPQALMALVLKHVIREVTVAEDGPPAEVVLTHPAHFGPYKRELMGEVIRLADVANARLITEPEAAAISYAQKSVIEPGRTVAVYDLGGGTFDAALVRRSRGGGFELVGSADGIDRLGGVDFDQLLAEMVLERADVSPEAMSQARPAELAAFRQRCRDAKEALSADDSADIAVGLGGIDSVTITRADFDQAIRPRILESVESLQRVIRSSGLSSADIDRVLLVGGSSRIPLVADTIRLTLGLPVAVDANPKFAICAGAALPPSTGAPPDTATPADTDTTAPAASFSPPAPPTPSSPPATATAPLPPVPVGEPAVDKNRRTGLIAAGVLALAGIIGGVIALSGGDDQKASPAAATNPQATNPGAATTPGPVTAPSTGTTPAPLTIPGASPSATAPSVTTPQPPLTTPGSAPAGTAETTAPMDAKVFLGGMSYEFSKLVLVPSEHKLELTAKVTNLSRNRFGGGDPYGLRYEGSDILLFFQTPGDLSRANATATATMSTTSLPDAFDLSKAQLLIGEAGEHQAVVDLGTGKVVEDLAPVPVAITGTATTNFGVAFTATSGEIVPWECSSASENIAFANHRKDEWSLLIHGNLVTGDVPAGGTTISDITKGFTRLKLPDGAVLAATATVGDVFGSNQRFRDSIICFTGLVAPGDGAYQLQIQSGDQPPIGTIDFTIPPGAISPDTPALPSTAPTNPDLTTALSASVFMGGGRWDLDGLQLGSTGQLAITGTLTNLSHNRFGGVSQLVAVRFGGSDIPLNVRTLGELDATSTSSRILLSTSGLPDGFDLSKAQLLIGDGGNHQAVVDLGAGKVIEDLAPVPIPITGAATTGFGITFTATGGEIVSWECSSDSSNIDFANHRNDEWSLIIHGTVTTGDTPWGGTTINDITRGFSRLKLPDGATLEASSTVGSVFGEFQRFRDSSICFTGLLAPGDGAYQLQIQAGDQPPTGTIDFTIPSGAITPDTPAAT